MSDPDYRQAEEAEHEQWAEKRQEELEYLARAEQEEKFCREMENKYPILKGWK